MLTRQTISSAVSQMVMRLNYFPLLREGGSLAGSAADGAGRTCQVLHFVKDWRPPFGERDLDSVEIARDDRVGEDRACLLLELGPAVPRRDVVQREQARLRVGGELGDLQRGRVSGLLRA